MNIGRPSAGLEFRLKTLANLLTQNNVTQICVR